MADFGKLEIYANGEKEGEIKGIVGIDGTFYCWDEFDHEHAFTASDWAKVMNYLDGDRGYTYYDSWEEVLEDYIDIWEQDFDEDEPTLKPTMDDIKKTIADWQVAEDCNGTIYITVDEDEE